MILRRWLGPLGRYRPGLFRKNMAAGFRNCDRWTLPAWARIGAAQSPEERLLAQQRLGGKVVYDIGAFTGAYALFFSRQVGIAGRVVAFEPQPASFAILLRNLECNHITNVLPLRLALGGRSDVRPLFMLPGMPTTASLAPDARTPLRRAVGLAQVARLDDLIGGLALPPPDFIKLDVEGLELEVLGAASSTLAAHRPLLLVEVHGPSRAAKLDRVRALSALLEPLGYALRHAETGRALSAESLTSHALPASGHVFAHAA